jgi:hypothetical protein
MTSRLKTSHCLLSIITAAVFFYSAAAQSTGPTPSITAKAIENSEPLSPIPFNAQYDVSLNGNNQLKGSRTLSESQNSDGEKTYTLEYKAEHLLFKIKEQSTFQWINNKLIPLAYNSERSHLFGARKKSVQFDWLSNTANFNYKKKNGHFAIEAGVIDPLSTLLVIATKIQQGMVNISVRETDDNDIETREYSVDGPEMLTTPIGHLETIKVSLNRKESTQIWLAVDLNYLAVKVRKKSKNGDTYELNIQKYEGPEIPRELPDFRG